jgi:glycerol-3-phosphate dehydrogenase subunit C
MTKKSKSIVDKSEQCIKCGLCTEYCPVARVTGMFPGPKQAGPDAQRFRRSKDPSEDLWVGLCIGCGTCDLVCPVGVNVSELNLMAKAKASDEKGFNLRDWLLGRTHRFGSLGVCFASVANTVLRTPVFRNLSDHLLGIDRRRMLPAYEKQSFRQWFKRHRSRGSKKIAYFYGCYTNTNEAAVGIAVVEVLEKNGFEVVVPKQECCGIPALGQGDIESARASAVRTARSLLEVVEAGYDIVFSSATCQYMVRCEYPGFFKIEGTDRLAAKVYDISEYLMMLHERGDLNADFKPIKTRLPYHAPCHLRNMGIGLPALDLLELVPGLEVEDIDAGCCGLGGTYGFKKETYQISMDVGQRLTRALKEFGSPVAVSDCEGCRIQIRHLTGLEAVHPVQILRDAYNGAQ